jgi:hypothetical protein
MTPSRRTAMVGGPGSRPCLGGVAMARARVERNTAGNPGPVPQLAPPVALPVDTATVLDLVDRLLHERGWCQGRSTDRAGRLSLDGAVDEAAASLARNDRERLGLAARTRNALTRSAGAGALAAWNDRPGRRIDEIDELLAIARFRAI